MKWKPYLRGIYEITKLLPPDRRDYYRSRMLEQYGEAEENLRIGDR